MAVWKSVGDKNLYGIGTWIDCFIQDNIWSATTTRQQPCFIRIISYRMCSVFVVRSFFLWPRWCCRKQRRPWMVQPKIDREKIEKKKNIKCVAVCVREFFFLLYLLHIHRSATLRRWQSGRNRFLRKIHFNQWWIIMLCCVDWYAITWIACFNVFYCERIFRKWSTKCDQIDVIQTNEQTIQAYIAFYRRMENLKKKTDRNWWNEWRTKMVRSWRQCSFINWSDAVVWLIKRLKLKHKFLLSALFSCFKSKIISVYD